MHIDDDTKEIIVSFVTEGFERLDDAEARLGELGAGDNEAVFSSVFGLFHSVKGSAGFLNFENVKSLTHDAEALLEVFLKEKVEAGPESIDTLLETVDLLRAMIEEISREYHDRRFAEPVQRQTAKIRDLVSALRGSPGKISKPPVITPNEIITCDMAERFLTETMELLDQAESLVLEMESRSWNPEKINSVFRAVHTVKGNAGFFGCADLEDLCMDLENLLHQARSGNTPRGDAFITQVLGRLDGIRSRAAETRVGGGGGPGNKAVPYRPLGKILVDMGAVDEAEVEKALEQQEKPLGELLVEAGAAQPDDVSRALEFQKTMASGAGADAEAVRRKNVRVDTAKLDRLFDLVGELITAEAMIINSPDLAGLKLDAFRKSYAALNKITRELQETAMMIRMIPLEGIFSKMNRLVRDLSRKSGKGVDFLVSGADTEMDKNIIEQISDPLVHIIRNAIDHGLESAAERTAAGKSEKGRLRLEARYEGSEIWISLEDDGRGLDRNRILAKASAQGLLQGDGADLEDPEVWRFIFRPGFSTAETVSDISGRGVGMDVVSKNLEKIRGRVDIKSEPGRGSQFILKIPLTMAIIEAITVRVGDNLYSIPQGDIVEFFRVAPDQIVLTGKDEEVVNLRGNLIPLVRLFEVFGLKPKARNVEEGILIVTASDGRKACLMVDEVVGSHQIVIKSLSEYLGEVTGLSGCTIMGDGSVSFIIDTAGLMSLRLE